MTRTKKHPDARWVGLVRNVMLGREGLHRELLIELAESAGAADVVSVLTTGNLLFTAPEETLDPVVERIEQEVAGVLGREEPIVVRSLDWLRMFTEKDPFSAHQHAFDECEVGFLSHRAQPIDPAGIPPPGRTTLVSIHARELVTARPRAGKDRPHVNRLLEQATGSRATARGWQTLVRIAGRS